MYMILHNLKIALRNLTNYKLQTLISVISIAIGIVMLAFAHSILSLFSLPSLYDQPYYDRTYKVWFYSINDGDRQAVTEEIIRTLKGNNGLRNAEKIVAYNGSGNRLMAEFHLPDSTVRKGMVFADIIDPSYPPYIGMRSAITGNKITVLKAGEAIIAEEYAKEIFVDSNPIGAVQINIYPEQTIPVTIVDIYKTQSIYDDKRANKKMLYCLSDSIEEYMPSGFFYAGALDVVLKKGCTEHQLSKEINERVKHLGLKVSLSKVLDDDDIRINITIRTFIYIIGSLILLAAIIGFLQMQIQLFKLRSRELALRIVNGAKRMNLFGMLFTEVSIFLCMSMFVAVVLAILLQDFLNKGLKTVLDIPIHNIWIYTLIVGVILLFLCSIIVWITISKIANSRERLAENMQHTRNHLFRNVMLGFQIVISIVFVCGTFILANGTKKILKAFNVPANDDFYKECLYLSPGYASKPEQLIEDMERLPALKKMVLFSGNGWNSIREIEENPEFREKYNNQTYFLMYRTNDTILPSLLGMDVQWFNRDIDRNSCLLISKKLYNSFNEFGILDKNTLTIDLPPKSLTLPIAGIINKVPYDRNEEALVCIMQDWDKTTSNYLLIPKSGKYKALAKSVDETIDRLEPTIINKMVVNYRTIGGVMPEIVDAVRSGGWILGSVSLLICIMSIFSTITLDTRARRKEIAVRKVNGAKNLDIYRLFGRVYLVLIFAALIISVPICVLFNNAIGFFISEIDPGCTLSPIRPIIIGASVVILLILLIVGWQIHMTMQVDPSKIIAKE